MSGDEPGSLTGGCNCGAVRYHLTSMPMFVHCCHCTWCQREGGGAFVVNALIESDRVVLTAGADQLVEQRVPSVSGQGQRLIRCPHCAATLWSHYAYGKLSEAVRFVRTVTLDARGAVTPDAHIYTASKQPWVVLDDEAPQLDEYYRARDLWPPESLERRAALLARHAS